MKKRIISISLALAMIVATVPSLLLSVFAQEPIDEVVYNVYTTSEHVYLDGSIDGAYHSSTRIVSEDANATWYAYPVATFDGFYLFARVEDDTMSSTEDADPKTGDGIAIYLDWTPYGYALDNISGEEYINSFASQVGTVFVDYEGNLTASGDFEYVVNNGGEVAVNKIHNPERDEVDESPRYIGYNIEIFIPYTDYMKTVVDTHSKNYHFGLGVQVNDADDGICNDEKYGESFELLPDATLRYASDMPYGSGSNYATLVESEIVLDGKNTKGEYDNAQVVHVDKGGTGDANEKNVFRVICDGTYLSVLMEMTDYTVNSGDRMALYFSRYGDENALTGEIIERTRGWIESGTTEFGCISTEGNDLGWSMEIRVELSEKEKSLYQAGKLIYGISSVFSDADAKGLVSCKSDVAELADCYQAETLTRHEGLYRIFTVSPDMNKAPKLKGANVALAESITMKFYATLGRADLDSKLKITMNEQVYYLGPQKTETEGEYKFEFKDIAPQYMADTMNVELIIDGEAVAGVYDYSVLKNVTSDDVLNPQTEQLIYDLLAYGKAVQDFVGYNVDFPINEGYKDKSQAGQLVIDNNDRTYTEPLEDARFTAANIYHDNVNVLFVKFEVLDIENTSVTIDGKPAIIEKYSETEYIVRTKKIKVVDFDKVYTFKLITPTGEQTLTYSINAYALAKCYAEHAETANLANALYAYGVAAKAYVESLNSVE